MKQLVAALLLVACVIIGSSGVDAAGTLAATLVWTNPVDITDGVQVEKSNSVSGIFTTIKQTAGNTVQYVDATNSPGDTACYRVAYFNTSGVGPYAGPVCKTFPTVPTQAPASFGVN